MELTDRTARLADFWGRVAGELSEQAMEAPRQAARVAVLENLLLSRLPRHEGDRRVNQVVAAVLRSRGTMPVQALACLQGISRQHLKNCFHDWVGTNPKFFSRVVRFRHLLAGLRANPATRWADAAQEFGYYDQAHLISDFREMTRTTPEDYRCAIPAR